MTAIDILAKQLWGMWAGFVALVPNMVIALVILGITWVVSRVARRIVDRVTGKASIRESLKQLIHTVVSIGVWVVGLVIAGTMLLWIAAQWLAPQFGLPGRYALLFDFAALAALIWAMVNISGMEHMSGRAY